MPWVDAWRGPPCSSPASRGIPYHRAIESSRCTPAPSCAGTGYPVYRWQLRQHSLGEGALELAPAVWLSQFPPTIDVNRVDPQCQSHEGT